jgi:hypothetical protein
MYPRTILSGMLTNVRPTAGGTVKQAFLHGRGGPRLMMRYGQAPQREISSLKLGATGICGTDLHFRNIGRLSCQCVKK